MNQKILFATNNAHKLEEVSAILGDGFEVLSLREIGCDTDIPETSDTFAGNAMQKASFVKEHYGYDCFADDSGLEVDILDGAPGVYSARYSGGGSEANMDKLLLNLTGKSERGAQFRTVIALIINGEEKLFNGIVKGSISNEKMGNAGFGYDPIFIPEGFSESFAQMTSDMKNSISHRYRATEELSNYLKQQYD